MTETTLESKQEETMVAEKAASIKPRRTFSPAIDIFETDDSIVLLVNMPGVPEENVDITLEKSQLTIRGKVEHEAPEGYKAVYGEYAVGDYKRTFSLSDAVNQDEIEAILKHGVLRLVIAKAAVAKPRQIAVRAGN
jgi:HSP20 family molecular chaperone IbpA